VIDQPEEILIRIGRVVGVVLDDTGEGNDAIVVARSIADAIWPAWVIMQAKPWPALE
jgi:hypothetical protein